MAARLDAFHARIPKVSKATLARIARKDSRILEITPDTFASNVARTSDLLNATTAAFFKLAFRQPALIYLDPWSLRLKLRRLAKHFGIRPKDLIPVIWRNPTILTRADEPLIAAIAALGEWHPLQDGQHAAALVKGQDRTIKLYATRCASVVCYFTESDDGGTVLHTDRGSGATLWDFEACAREVRADVLAFVGERLRIPAGDVLKCKFAHLVGAADPDLPEEYRFARRDNRAYPRRF